MHTRPPHGGWHPGSCRTPREGAEDTGAAAPHRSAACERTTGEGPAKGCLVETRRGQGRRSGGALARPAALPAARALGAGGAEAERPLRPARAARHGLGPPPLQQLLPAPPRRGRVGCRRGLHPVLAGHGHDGPAQVALGRQSAALAPQRHAGQGHEGRQLLHACQGRAGALTCSPVMSS
jgi:hypothetical protein